MIKLKVHKSYIRRGLQIIGSQRGASKEEVLKAANQLQKKIHPDMNRNVDSSRLSQLVNEAKKK